MRSKTNEPILLNDARQMEFGCLLVLGLILLIGLGSALYAIS